MEKNEKKPVNLTALLADYATGNHERWNDIFNLVYQDLRKTARHMLGSKSSGTLQPTALVNETYMRLAQQSKFEFQNRAQFFAIAARIMRRVLVDNARMHLADKRGGGETHVEFLDSIQIPAQHNSEQLLELNDLIENLAKNDPRAAAVWELRFFIGSDLEEIATTLEISPATVKRDLVFANAWLQSQL